MDRKQLCTPKNAIYYKFGQSCFSSKNLSEMARALNLRIVSKPKGVKWHKISDELGNDVAEVLWIDEVALRINAGDDVQKQRQREAIRDIQPTAFRPQLGLQRGEWIGSEQLDGYLTMLTKFSTKKTILAQYTHNLRPLNAPESTMERYYLDYRVRPGFGGWRSNQIKNKWTRYVIITNTDVAVQGRTSGSHWVVIYVDRTKKTPGLEYYDSMRPGEPPKFNAELKKTWNQFKKWNNEGVFGPTLPVHVNALKVQRKGRECGMFAMWFVSERVNGKTMAQLSDKRLISDAKCALLRKKYFRPSPNQAQLNEILRLADKARSPSPKKNKRKR